MLYPTRLVLGDDGIILTQAGRPQNLPWAEIASVNTQVIRPPVVATGVGTYNPRTMTVVVGAGGQKLFWMPIFGVSPDKSALPVGQNFQDFDEWMYNNAQSAGGYVSVGFLKPDGVGKVKCFSDSEL